MPAGGKEAMRNRIVATAALLLLVAVQESAAQVQRFVQQWAGPDAIANGFITFDLALLNNPGGSDTGIEPFVTDFEFHVTGAFSGNGTFTLADYGEAAVGPPGHISLHTEDVTLDFTRELIGQPTTESSWGALAPGDGGFLLFRAFGSQAPSVAGDFTVATNYGTDMLRLTSLRPALCADAPVGSLDCRAAVGSRLVIKDTASADSIKWSWTGDGFEQSDLGDPVAGDTYYSLCIYDETAGVAALAAELSINRGEGWTDETPRGLDYAHDGSSFGVTRARIRTAADTTTSVKLQGGTEALSLPAPFGTEFFDQDGTVTVQLVSSEGTCWSSSYSVADTSRNDAGRFKARME